MGPSAGFEDIRSMTFDGNQRLVVVDGNRLRYCSKQGVVTTFYGDRAAGHVDGAATAARFKAPRAVPFDAHDGSLHVADTGNHSIRRITPELQVCTRAGDGQGGHQDGHATATSLSSPSGLACVGGWVYTLDAGSNTIRCISPSGGVTTIAGKAGTSGCCDRAGEAALLGVSENAACLCTNQLGQFVFTHSTNGGRLRRFCAAQHSVAQHARPALIDDLAALLDDEAATDLTVLAADGRPIRSLRGLLRARSAHFKAMLDSGCQEGQQGTKGEPIKLPHSFPAVRAVFRFLHTDQLEVEDSAIVEVLELSEMWDLPALKALVEVEIARRICPANASLFFITTHRHSAKMLRTHCLSYIANHYASVRTHENLKDLPKEMLLEVMLAITPGSL